VRRLIFVLMFALTGCQGTGAIFLTIDARGPDGTLRIPEDVDRLSVDVTDASGKVELLQKSYPLERDTHRFPLSLAIEPGRQTTSPVTIEVQGFFGTTPVGLAKASVPIVPSQTSNITIRFEKN
jgi:hypothetical protein